MLITQLLDDFFRCIFFSYRQKKFNSKNTIALTPFGNFFKTKITRLKKNKKRRKVLFGKMGTFEKKQRTKKKKAERLCRALRGKSSAERAKFNRNKAVLSVFKQKRWLRIEVFKKNA